MALVLCIGADPTLMKTRRLILELAGHRVVSVTDEQDVPGACKDNHFDVAIIGQSVRPEKKRLMAKLIRQFCSSAKILELFPPHQGETLEDADSWLPVPPSAPNDFTTQVTKLANSNAA